MLRPRTVREGSVGLFALLGLIVLGGVAIWLRGGGFGTPSYRIFVDFDDASGLQVGAPVRFRGVAIGKLRPFHPVVMASKPPWILLLPNSKFPGTP